MARPKLAAEQIVLRNPRHIVVRTSLNGGVSRAGNRGFNEHLRLAWQAGRGMNLFTDEFRCPIFAGETARAVWELANQESHRAFSRRGRGKTFALANRPAHRGALAAAQSQNHAGLWRKISPARRARWTRR